ncbi:phosphatidylinositol N-acetylglucosaminyltransferase subunit H-like [Pollicipes pollicipes]|uniref:phosphatidylinositol N-acetylglucosaminyltransferase subunit H-like n=1 Tax=Pollicipes pollicipes TaxID=41117 RepID=UPI0018853780|nr:phosphatidylinositol N-acetylglucosaminyltransferase subunit H-like [Pollicipes pollicipes]
MVRVLRCVPGRLAEYEVSGAPFSVSLWLNLTALIAALLFWLGLHTLDDRLLVALLVGLTAALLAKLHLKVKRETLLVESSLGVQLTTTFASGRRSSLFIRRGRLSDVVIAEALTMHRVVAYLAIVLRHPPRLVPLFRHTWPRVAQLRDVYRGIQLILRPEEAARR